MIKYNNDSDNDNNNNDSIMKILLTIILTN